VKPSRAIAAPIFRANS